MVQASSLKFTCCAVLPIVSSQGGILVEFLKFLGLHMGLHPGDRFFWYSTTGWVMWNIVQGALLLGATPILYIGSPGWPDMQALWKLAEKTRMSVFGTSAAFLHACMGADINPGESCDLSQLKTIGSKGSPLSPEGFDWVYRKVKMEVPVKKIFMGVPVAAAVNLDSMSNPEIIDTFVRLRDEIYALPPS